MSAKGAGGGKKYAPAEAFFAEAEEEFSSSSSCSTRSKSNAKQSMQESANRPPAKPWQVVAAKPPVKAEPASKSSRSRSRSLTHSSGSEARPKAEAPRPPSTYAETLQWVKQKEQAIEIAVREEKDKMEAVLK